MGPKVLSTGLSEDMCNMCPHIDIMPCPGKHHVMADKNNTFGNNRPGCVSLHACNESDEPLEEAKARLDDHKAGRDREPFVLSSVFQSHSAAHRLS